MIIDAHLHESLYSNSTSKSLAELLSLFVGTSSN